MWFSIAAAGAIQRMVPSATAPARRSKRGPSADTRSGTATRGSPVTTLAYQSDVKPSASARSAWATTLSTVLAPPVNPIRTVASLRLPYERTMPYDRMEATTRGTRVETDLLQVRRDV